MLYVLDSSALLTMMQHEKGCEVVDALIEEHECVISSVNLAEVGTKLIDRGLAPERLKHSLEQSDVQPIDFDAEQSLLCSQLRLQTRSAGLSLGDRACLALAKLMKAQAVTADRAWADVEDAVGVKLVLIR